MPVRAILAIAGISALLFGSTAMAKNNKVDVCHQQGNGGYHIINVNENALDAHLGHGDWLVEDEVCDDGIDNDCDGDVDEDCAVCPCFTRDDLEFYWPDLAPTWIDTCTDGIEDDGYYHHYWLDVYGSETVPGDHQGYVDAYVETWGVEGAEYAYCKTHFTYRDYRTWDWFEDGYEGYITLDEYAECDATLATFLEDAGVVCRYVAGY